jgi:hypothetical protein
MNSTAAIATPPVGGNNFSVQQSEFQGTNCWPRGRPWWRDAARRHGTDWPGIAHSILMVEDWYRGGGRELQDQHLRKCDPPRLRLGLGAGAMSGTIRPPATGPPLSQSTGLNVVHQIGEWMMSKPELKEANLADPASAAIPDPFDLESLRLGQDFIETAGVKKLLTTVPVRKPNPQDFVRVHSDPNYRGNFLCIDLKDDRETYLVRPEIAPHLIGETVMKTVFTAISRQGVVFLWPVTIPPPDGKSNEWWRSAREAAELAMTRWLRIRANMSLGAYEMAEAEGQIPDPQWPNVSYQELLRIGFRAHMVDRSDHPVRARLRGA